MSKTLCQGAQSLALQPTDLALGDPWNVTLTFEFQSPFRFWEQLQFPSNLITHVEFYRQPLRGSRELPPNTLPGSEGQTPGTENLQDMSCVVAG